MIWIGIIVVAAVAGITWASVRMRKEQVFVVGIVKESDEKSA